MPADTPFDEALVLPRALEDLARNHPNTTWMTVPNDSKLSKGWRSITYGDLQQAVDGFALWAESIVGDADVIAYIGINDVNYAVSQIGIMKMGRAAFLPSPRNDAKSSASLFETTVCNILLHSESMDAQIELLKPTIPTLRTHLMPSFDHLRLQSAKAAYESQSNAQEDALALILQTSGSTGSPRPITITNGGLSTFKNVSDLALPPQFKTQGAAQAFGKPMLSMAPFFHEAGSILIVRSILCRGPAILPPPDQPVTAELMLEMIRQTKPSIVTIFPSVLEHLVGLPGGLETLSKVDMVTFGGAPLSQEVGDKVSDVTFLYSGIGSTEAGVLAVQLPRDRKDWNYFAWAPASGVEMQPRDDDLWECVIKRADRRYQRIFHTYPEISEYRTKDLFEQHPTKTGLWRFRGRADDVLVLSNGEKLNPVHFEKQVELHPLVKGALVVGHNKFQTVLLIEPKWDSISAEKDASEILEEIWPTIEKANQLVPKYGVVWKSKLAITRKEKPFVRTSTKGNIVRTQSTALYATEIEALYASEAFKDMGKLSSNASLSEVETFLRSILQTAILSTSSEISNHQDLFAQGMDSLQTLQLTSIINHSMGRAISTAEVYKHPTISNLAAFLAKKDQSIPADSDRLKAMGDMVEKYTAGMPARSICQLDAKPVAGDMVLLTGSTGNLGCLLLQELIDSSSVRQIYCLNRAVYGRARQSQQFEVRGLPVDFCKVSFLHSEDFSQENLGLPADVYEEILGNIDLIILNAWMVDFNKNLASFEGLIAGTRRFVDLSIASKRRAHIVLVSSVASVGNGTSIHGDGKVPESVISDHSVPAPGGYGESKHVASMVLAAAANAGVPSTIIRVGQLAGPAEKESQVEWNSREWIPSLIATSKMMGVIPGELGGLNSVDWVPIDLAARAIIEIAQLMPAENPRVLHVVNPNTTSWKELLPAFEGAIPIITYAEWLVKLREIPRTKSNAERIPGIKLLDFYEGIAVAGGSPRLATEKTRMVSSTMAGLGPVDVQLMGRWVRGME